MNLRALIVDDERLARENLSMLLEQYCEDVEVVGTAGSVEDAIQAIKDLKPEVVFLDIRMPSGIEGFDLLDAVDTSGILIVFVTAFKDYAIKAFQANAIHYLLKPIDIGDLQNAVGKLVDQAGKATTDTGANYQQLLNSVKEAIHLKANQKIAISHSKGIKLVEDNSISHIEASGNCCTLHFENGDTYLDTRTLKWYDDILDKHKFIRIHKSHLINMNFVKEYIHVDGHRVILKSGESVPISRNRLSEFISRIKRY